jgi:thiamine pyrophosphokinase
LPQIAVDGGIQFAHEPILWTGDGDSGAPPAHAPVFFKHGQDVSDLRFCLNGIRAWAWDSLHMVGFLGARLDHALANLGELHAEFLARPAFRRAMLYDAALKPALAFMAAGAHDMDIDGVFSVLAVEAATISISGGCDYPAAGIAVAPLSGRGISNQGRGRVHFECNQPFMVLRVFAPAA